MDSKGLGLIAVTDNLCILESLEVVDFKEIFRKCCSLAKEGMEFC